MLKPYQTIMVPLDGSDLAEQALPHAREIAQRQGGRLILFGVAPDVARALSRSLILPEMVAIRQAHQVDEQPVIDHFSEALEQAAETIRRQHVEVDVVVQIGSPAEQIIDFAVEMDIDLIVMSTHGRTGVGRWVYGSVANKVIGHAPCPVLLVRVPPEELAGSLH
ncbi:MAG: universal stress protein [Caldilineaceae bacterium]|nr:universal stress protein [Caldilineaceae bacterium]